MEANNALLSANLAASTLPSSSNSVRNVHVRSGCLLRLRSCLSRCCKKEAGQQIRAVFLEEVDSHANLLPNRRRSDQGTAHD